MVDWCIQRKKPVAIVPKKKSSTRLADDRGTLIIQPGTARRGLLATLGPGLMWAAASIGVSHLVQSTRAPALAYLNLRAVTLPSFPDEFRPGRGLLALSYGGLGLLSVVAVVFLISRFI